MKSVTHIECESAVCVLFAAASDQEMVHTYNGLSDVSSQPKITDCLCLVYQTTEPCCPQVGLRQLLRRLEREKGEVEWQLKDCEWRLDQEAAVSRGLLAACMHHGGWN